jgi:NADH-quinone oxidoreductase subunit C
MESDKKNLLDLISSEISELKIIKSNNYSAISSLENNYSLYKTIKFIKDSKSLKFDLLTAIYGVDYLLKDKKNRFEVIYNFLSMKNNFRLIIKISIDDGELIDSICDLYPSANWYEREVYDMFGIKFNNHPDMRRILTDYNFEHHPLQKDFPVFGYQQIKYDPVKQDIIYESVSLTQEFREFDTASPWRLK